MHYDTANEKEKDFASSSSPQITTAKMEPVKGQQNVPSKKGAVVVTSPERRAFQYKFWIFVWIVLLFAIMYSPSLPATMLALLSSLPATLSRQFNGHGMPRQQTNSTTAACSTACTQIEGLFPSDTIYPGNGNFTVWDTKQQEVVSACRVLPSTTDDVVAILGVLLDNWCNFAVKSGGHARQPDDSVSVGGVTIDMANFKSIEVAADRQTARLGTGHTLDTLYTGLEAYNLTTAGGRSGGVGLGGYALGGGFSNISPKYGLGIDNVYEYDLVLPNATYVKVTESSQPDLYWALRGGMGNFGIVTHFNMTAVPEGLIFGGNAAFSEDKKDALVAAAYDLTFTNDTAASWSMGFSWDQASGNFSLSMAEAYTQNVDYPATYAAVNSIEMTSSTLRIDSQSAFAEETASYTPNGGRNLFATLTYFPSQELDKQMMSILAEEIEPLKNQSGFFPNVIIQPYNRGAIIAGRARGGNAYGIDVDGPLSIVLLTSVWDDAADDAAQYAFAERFVARATQASADAGLAHPWLYVNYAYTSQEPFASYGDENHARLKAIQKAVDPRGVFSSQGLSKGYFKLN